jgi:hypothetical protein
VHTNLRKHFDEAPLGIYVVLAIIMGVVFVVAGPICSALAATSVMYRVDFSGIGSGNYEPGVNLEHVNYGSRGVQARHVKISPIDSGCGWYESPPFTDIDITAYRTSNGSRIASVHYNSWDCYQTRLLPSRFHVTSGGLRIVVHIQNVRVNNWRDYHDGHTTFRVRHS